MLNFYEISIKFSLNHKAVINLVFYFPGNIDYPAISLYFKHHFYL